MTPDQVNFENLHFNPFYNESFSDTEVRKTQMKISLMKSIHTTSNILIFFQMRLKVSFLRNEFLKLLMQSM